MLAHLKSTIRDSGSTALYTAYTFYITLLLLKLLYIAKTLAHVPIYNVIRLAGCRPFGPQSKKWDWMDTP